MSGKSHVGCGIGHALIDAGYRVLYMRTSELVQRLQAARQNLQLPQALAKLDRYDLLILDDLSYVRKDQAETSVLFELIAERYERRSILITANQPFSGWDNVFPDPGMTVAAIDRLVHHSTIFELHKVESYRGKEAARQQKIQRDNEKAESQARASNSRYRMTWTSIKQRSRAFSPPHVVRHAAFAVDRRADTSRRQLTSAHSPEPRHEPVTDDNHPRPTGQDDCRSTGHAA